MSLSPRTPGGPAHPRRRGGGSAMLIAAGLVSTALLSLSTSGTLSAFTAQITNSVDSVATGYLAMSETLTNSAGVSQGTVCNSNDGTTAGVANNSATCSTINKYGGTATPIVPGASGATTYISIKNTGTVAANSFQLTPGACSQSAVTGAPQGGATDVCSQVTITIMSGTTQVYSGTAAAMTTMNLLTKLGVSSVAAGASYPFAITASLPTSLGNTYQGYQIAQQLSWTFGS